MRSISMKEPLWSDGDTWRNSVTPQALRYLDILGNMNMKSILLVPR